MPARRSEQNTVISQPVPDSLETSSQPDKLQLPVPQEHTATALPSLTTTEENADHGKTDPDPSLKTITSLNEEAAPADSEQAGHDILPSNLKSHGDPIPFAAATTAAKGEEEFPAGGEPPLTDSLANSSQSDQHQLPVPKEHTATALPSLTNIEENNDHGTTDHEPSLETTIYLSDEASPADSEETGHDILQSNLKSHGDPIPFAAATTAVEDGKEFTEGVPPLSIAESAKKEDEINSTQAPSSKPTITMPSPSPTSTFLADDWEKISRFDIKQPPISKEDAAKEVLYFVQQHVDKDRGVLHSGSSLVTISPLATDYSDVTLKLLGQDIRRSNFTINGEWALFAAGDEPEEIGKEFAARLKTLFSGHCSDEEQVKQSISYAVFACSQGVMTTPYEHLLQAIIAINHDYRLSQITQRDQLRDISIRSEGDNISILFCSKQAIVNVDNLESKTSLGFVDIEQLTTFSLKEPDKAVICSKFTLNAASEPIQTPTLTQSFFVRMMKNFIMPRG